jgi:hypothetical protein
MAPPASVVPKPSDDGQLLAGDAAFASLGRDELGA